MIATHFKLGRLEVLEVNGNLLKCKCPDNSVKTFISIPSKIVLGEFDFKKIEEVEVKNTVHTLRELLDNNNIDYRIEFSKKSESTYFYVRFEFDEIGSSYHLKIRVSDHKNGRYDSTIFDLPWIITKNEIIKILSERFEFKDLK